MAAVYLCSHSPVGALLFVALGQGNAKGCPVRFVGAVLQASAMRLDDDLADGKSNAYSGSLGRKKRFKDAIAIPACYSDARIFHGNRNVRRSRHATGSDR